MTTITCKIPEKVNAALEAIAAQRGISKSEVVRQSILSSISQNGKRVKLSAYDAMKAGCGIVRSGHRDLASNPKHMKGFGRE